MDRSEISDCWRLRWNDYSNSRENRRGNWPCWHYSGSGKKEIKDIIKDIFFNSSTDIESFLPDPSKSLIESNYYYSSKEELREFGKKTNSYDVMLAKIAYYIYINKGDITTDVIDEDNILESYNINNTSITFRHVTAIRKLQEAESNVKHIKNALLKLNMSQAGGIRTNKKKKYLKKHKYSLKRK